MTKAERKASDKRIAEARAEAQAVVESNVCPDCGSGLRRNLSLTGWWQCEQFGADTHRARAADPACNWQGFTE